MKEKRDLEINNYEIEFWKLIETNLNLKLMGMSTIASPIDDGPIVFKARIPTKNSMLKGTNYFYSSSKKIIHFTSLQVLFSIINDGALRLYNLHNSNDENEYLFAVQTLEDVYKAQGIKESDLKQYYERIKELSFTLSCTDLNGLTKRNFWEKYGDKSKGVAIEFEIINEPETWEYFYFSKVHYDKSDIFEKLAQEWTTKQLQFPYINYHIKLDQLLSLHKSSDWLEEEEIRILTLYPDLYRTTFEKQIFNDFKPYKPICKIKYFKLPLCDKEGNFIDDRINNREEFFWSKIPRIRISNIYWGPDFPVYGLDLINFKDKLKHYISEKMNCWLKNLPINRQKIE